MMMNISPMEMHNQKLSNHLQVTADTIYKFQKFMLLSRAITKPKTKKMQKIRENMPK